MFVCQWHLDIPFGKQAEAVRIAYNRVLLGAPC